MDIITVYNALNKINTPCIIYTNTTIVFGIKSNVASLTIASKLNKE